MRREIPIMAMLVAVWGLAFAGQEPPQTSITWQLTQVQLLSPDRVGAYDANGDPEYITAASGKQFLVVDARFAATGQGDGPIDFRNVLLSHSKTNDTWQPIGVGLFDTGPGYVAFVLPRASTRPFTRIQRLADSRYHFVKTENSAVVNIDRAGTRLCWLYEVPAATSGELRLRIGTVATSLPEIVKWTK